MLVQTETDRPTDNSKIADRGKQFRAARNCLQKPVRQHYPTLSIYLSLYTTLFLFQSPSPYLTLVSIYITLCLSMSLSIYLCYSPPIYSLSVYLSHSSLYLYHSLSIFVALYLCRSLSFSLTHTLPIAHRQIQRPTECFCVKRAYSHLSIKGSDVRVTVSQKHFIPISKHLLLSNGRLTTLTMTTTAAAMMCH